MAIDLAGDTVTGEAQNGLTSPTYTLSADRTPDGRSSQFAVTSLGGTQTNVRTHKASDPFTITFRPPSRAVPRPIISADGIIVGNVAMMEYQYLLRKGVFVYGTNIRYMQVLTKIMIPAGADSVDPVNIRAALSLYFGIGNTEGQNMGNDVVNGTW